jgi:hypothetical protein
MGTSIASDPTQQDGVDGEQPEHGRADSQENEIHVETAPVYGAVGLGPAGIKVRRVRRGEHINET